MNISKTLPYYIVLALLLGAVPSLNGSSVDVTAVSALTSRAYCPFCAAINATFAEQISKHEVSVIAKLVEVPKELGDNATEFPKAKFEIIQVLKGEQFVATGMSFQTQLVGTYPIGHKFLVMGVEPPNLFWSTPMQASDRVIKYLTDSQGLPATGPDRFAFFQEYFEDPETDLAFDAYDEFAIAAYADVVALKDRIKRDKLIKWINDPELRVDRRRLYFTMLGVCGTEDDIRMLEKFLVSDEPADRAGLDALAAAYITLKGEAGIPLLEEHFLKNVDEENTADTVAVISALRFHGTELEQIPRMRIAQAIRLVLKHPQLADTVIPDLARWEDWTVIEQMVDLFKNCDEEYQYVRVPVVAYLHSCPKPEAKTYLKELETIDPDAIRRAKFYMGLDDEEETEDTEPELESEPIEPQAKEIKKEGNGDQEATPKLKAKSSDKSGDNEGSFIALMEPGSSEVDNFPVVPVSTTGRFSETQAEVDETDSPEPDELTNANAATTKRDAELAGLTRNQSVPVPISKRTTQTSNKDPGLGVTKSASPSNTIKEAAPVAMISTRDISWLIIFVPLACSVVIFVLIWSVVNGWFERLIF